MKMRQGDVEDVDMTCQEVSAAPRVLKKPHSLSKITPEEGESQTARQ